MHMQARFKKTNVFNLDDGEELTHMGTSLSKIDDFDDELLGSSDDEDKSGMYY